LAFFVPFSPLVPGASGRSFLTTERRELPLPSSNMPPLRSGAGAGGLLSPPPSFPPRKREFRGNSALFFLYCPTKRGTVVQEASWWPRFFPGAGARCFRLRRLAERHPSFSPSRILGFEKRPLSFLFPSKMTSSFFLFPFE